MKKNLKKLVHFIFWLLAINPNTPRNRFIKSFANQYIQLCSDYGVEPEYTMDQIHTFKDDFVFEGEFKNSYYLFEGSGISIRIGQHIYYFNNHQLYQANHGCYIQ